MRELVVDNFAGGGGASTGIEWALGQVDVALNHDDEALAMHRANHPHTRHISAKITAIDPLDVTGGQPVGLAWFSPTCTHFSKAKGAALLNKNIRDLAWVVPLWAERVRPRVIMLENVEEFLTWGDLGPDGRPDPDHRGKTFQLWVHRLRRAGYRVEWRELRACDYGAPTIRKRLFVIARCDRRPIVWPEPTHGPGLIPYRTADECIDWSVPCPSIFSRPCPLADATLRRIARGVKRYVLDSPNPFIVHRGMAPTITTGGHHALVSALLAITHKASTGQDCRNPINTLLGSNHMQLVAANLLKLRHYSYAQNLSETLHTVAAGGQHFGLVAAFLHKYYKTGTGQCLHDPLHTGTTADRFSLVTVVIDGQEYALADIGMRMLTPRELFRAQGFPDSYVIDPIGPSGRPLSKTAQVRMCGNSVCPQVAEAIVRANVQLQRIDSGRQIEDAVIFSQ